MSHETQCQFVGLKNVPVGPIVLYTKWDGITRRTPFQFSRINNSDVVIAGHVELYGAFALRFTARSFRQFLCHGAECLATAEREMPPSPEELTAQAMQAFVTDAEVSTTSAVRDPTSDEVVCSFSAQESDRRAHSVMVDSNVLGLRARPAEISIVHIYRGSILMRFCSFSFEMRVDHLREFLTRAYRCLETQPQSDRTRVGEQDARARAYESGMRELSQLIGLSDVKKKVEELEATQRVALARRARGISSTPLTVHCVFAGNPGTGKTTVARILAKLFYGAGVVEREYFKECSRADLVGEYIGHTAPLVRKAFMEAKGGVLFIDEAYSLARDGHHSEDFGREAIEELLKLMEDHRDGTVVVVAGYPKELDDFLGANPGLRSRFAHTILFPDYSADELLQVFDGLVREHGSAVEAGADEQLRAILLRLVRLPGYANARSARQLFEKAWLKQGRRLGLAGRSADSLSDADLTTLLARDLAEAAEELTASSAST